ncbi:MAG: hypothetical protein PPHEMADM_4200 [uncultured Paraburkholderia sp.]|nr:MAG: hypothetical protein PPHEESC_2595 [uncultured Paraburkholderia sp.]CAH2793693.1 MAG: hypothetical protein PPHEINF_3774 [uncultured Paraburkholderia sp.]CAH2900712.1 MAG: hypothetical protein PPHEMADE_4149 [uncultured Paraburkholderia sp.]CAH2920607.1 MAG: hypothetical protein PPHERAN_2065 [uncultured Paraburkholderia sp.]CAH2937057.1 MAG: hypothetical protein PPHEMADM_4200 [uncultured Paraburkholderia sp.]
MAGETIVKRGVEKALLPDANARESGTAVLVLMRFTCVFSAPRMDFGGIGRLA